MRKNQLTLEERKYPIDFGVKIIRSATTILTIPEGYAVDALPKNAILTLPDKAASFTLQASQIGKTIYLTSVLKVNKTVYFPEEYLPLKEFFARVVAKKTEQIVLRKKE